jgi:alpha-L-fucosidase
MLAGTPLLRAEDVKPSVALVESGAPGPFRPYWESLKQYECPEWFREAKFGMWAHWSPQCVPEAGDWYARNMYLQGSEQYKYHLAHYGHPSKFGYKDICHIWKAENWDPEWLIQLYKRVGAKYFVALANHHDNFDCWDSKYQAWNSVNMGPKRDIVGTWAQTARKHGLRFGVTFHATPGRTWYEFMPVKYGSDKYGPLKGVPYDGNLSNADGKGQWWEGLDLRSLYGPPHTQGEPCPGYTHTFMLRVQDLIDNYHPDLLSFDDSLEIVHDVAPSYEVDSWLGIPDLAPQIAAYYYNSNIQSHGGKLEAVLDIKQVPEPLKSALVEDLEMSGNDKLMAHPWQTEFCIGEWHYKRGIKYKTAANIVPMLVDIVSKNGNLLLNIPVRGDGTIDSDEVAFLEEMAKWVALNGEAIFSTCPWKIFGEGPTAIGEAALYQGKPRPCTSEDIRFTTKGDTLYAIALGWPEDGMLRVNSLASSSPYWKGPISHVELLGSDAKLKWSRDKSGLIVWLPPHKPCDYAFGLRVSP